MTSTPIDPMDPDVDPDGVPGDDPEVPTDPDQQDPEIIPSSESREEIAAPDPVEDK